MLVFRFACASLVAGLALFSVTVVIHAQSLDDLKALNQRVDTLYKAGKFREAIPVAKEYAERIRERLGVEHAEYATAQHALAVLYNQSGQTSEAEAAAKLSLLLRERLLEPNHPLIADTLIVLSNIDRRLGRKVEREMRVRRALSIRETALGREHPQVADALAGLALLCDPPACTPETEWAMKRAIAIREKALGPQNRTTLLTRLMLARHYWLMGKLSDAEALYRQCIPEWERQFPADQFELGVWLQGLGEVARGQGRLDEARELHLRSLAIGEKMLPADNPAIVASINALGMIAEAQGKHLDATQWYERLAPLAANNPNMSWALFSLARSYHSAGRYRDAEPAYVRALEITEKVQGPNHLHVADALNELANLFHAQGRYLEAVPLHKRALDIREKQLGREHANVAVSLHNLASLYQYLGNYQEAQEMGKRALDITEKTLGPNHGKYAQSLMVLAYIYENLGRHEDALPLIERAIGIYEKAPEQYQASLAGAIQGLASIRRLQGRHGEAEALLRRSIEIENAALGAEHPNLVSSYNALANLLDEVGRTDEAKGQLEKALAIAENTLGRDHTEALWSRVSLALREAEAKPEVDILPMVESARALAEAKLGSVHPAFVPAFTRVGRTFMLRQEWLSAYQYLKRGSEIAEQLERYIDHRTVLSHALVRSNEFNVPYTSAIRAAYRIPAHSQYPALADEVFRLSQTALQTVAAKALGQMAARFASGSSPLAALVRERQDLLSRRTAMERQFFLQKAGHQTGRRDLDPDFSAIDARLGAVDERLKREHPDYMQFASPEPLTIAEVQGLLRSNEVLVQFMEAPKVGNLPSEIFVWVVSKRESRWASASLDGQSINRMVNSLRCELEQTQWAGEATQCQHLLGRNSTIGHGSSTFDIGAAHALYRELLEPFDDLIKGKHLLVVPSGALASLPIHVLVTDISEDSTGHGDALRNAKWLIARQPITVLPSVASLKALRRAGASKASKPYIAFGNPLLDGNPARTGESDRSALARHRQTCPLSPTTLRVASMPKVPPFKPLARGGLADIEAIRRLLPLPETADELCTVAASLGAEPREVRLGSAATEREAKGLSESGQLASYRTIHFATHGALSGEIEGNAEPGLVLTPPTIASEQDDGYLTASEIATLKLDADWVVLSACNTAGPGAASADSLSGIARAFFYAGTRSLLVSHWAVDSDATVELVTKTFAALQADPNMTRAEALRRSMLALIERGGAHAHPRMWAPFVVVGAGWASSSQKDVAAGSDGTWIVTVKGETCGVAEVSDKSTYPMTVSGGLITGLNGRLRGKVSPSGVARWTIPAADGSLVRFQGTLFEKKASGRVSRTDGPCESTFTAKRKAPKNDPLGQIPERRPRKKSE